MSKRYPHLYLVQVPEGEGQGASAPAAAAPEKPRPPPQLRLIDTRFLPDPNPKPPPVPVDTRSPVQILADGLKKFLADPENEELIAVRFPELRRIPWRLLVAPSFALKRVDPHVDAVGHRLEVGYVVGSIERMGLRDAWGGIALDVERDLKRLIRAVPDLARYVGIGIDLVRVAGWKAPRAYKIP
jgi:hypothetical protein